jgi:L-cysteine/cystine lyase
MSTDAGMPKMVAADWAAFRARFPVTERAIYMNTGWSGPSSREVVAAIQRRIEREAFDGPTAPEVRHEKALLVQEARAALASVVGAGEVALMYSTTEGVNAVLRGLGLGPGDEVLTCNLEHSSVMVPCYHLRRTNGVDVSVVRSSANETAEELAMLFEDAITARTKLVVVSHISYNRGTRLPVERIIRAAHERGALVLLDGAQSAGQIEVGVRALDVDFYAFPAHKFVFGPDGVGGLYVRPDLLARVEPPFVGHAASEYYDFEGGYTPRTETVLKFQLPTHSGPLVAGVIEAVRLLTETGIAAIEARGIELSSRLLDGLARIERVDVRTPLDPALRSALVTFTIGDQDPNETCAALWTIARVVGRVAGDKRVRLSLAAFNDEADVDTALDAIEQLATRGLPSGAMTAEQYKEQLAEDDD